MKEVQGKDPLQQTLPIVVNIELTPFEYEEGSIARCCINPTRAWLRAWRKPVERIEEEKDADGNVTRKGETPDEHIARSNEITFALVLYVLESVVLKAGGNTKTIVTDTPESVSDLIDLDPRLLAEIIEEAIARGEARVVNAKRTFQESRDERAGSTGSVRNPSGGGVANPDTDDKRGVPDQLPTG
jgi:hypothetical protein